MRKRMVLRFELFPLFLLLPSLATDSNTTKSENNNKGAFVEAFRDDFSGNALDRTKWNPTDHQSEVNSELEYYTPENVLITNGFLTLRTRQAIFNGGVNYTSGRIDTKDKFDFLYGQIEWRAKVPKGQGFWPAMWLADPECQAAVPCPNHWPPAIIIEARGDLPKETMTSVFLLLRNGQITQFKNPQPIINPVDLSLDFHNYTISWSEEKLIWFLDSKEVFQVSGDENVPSQRMQIIINLAVGGVFPGNPDNSSVFPSEFLIDYVVVRQNIFGPRLQTASTPKFVAPLAGTLCAILLVGLILFVGVLLHERKQKRVCHGNMRKQSDPSSVNTDFTTDYQVYTPFDPLLQHYVNMIEVPLANIEVSYYVLGKGEFGIVYRGVARGLRGQPRPTVVAVKTLLDTNNVYEKDRLMEEIKLMTKIGRHLNIVNLLGAVVKGKLLLLLEFCPFGSLLKYLKSHRGAYFYGHVDSDGQLLPFQASQAENLEKKAKDFHRRQSFPEDNFDEAVLSTNDLINFAYQISRGMEYLSSQSIIHRDLAARNVLVAENKVLKIADFGMARQRESNYVLQNSHVALPLKWMPPEAIEERIFSQKSDAWSFGIVLWELFTLGDTPYSGASYAQEVLSLLTCGTRLERPVACPNTIYSLMEKCWMVSPEERPTFTFLRDELQTMVDPDSADAYLILDQSYLNFNRVQKDVLSSIIVSQICS